MSERAGRVVVSVCVLLAAAACEGDATLDATAAPIVKQAGAVLPTITHRFPTYTNPLAIPTGNLIPAANNRFCGSTGTCDSDDFNGFPLYHAGQRLPLDALIALSSPADTVTVTARRFVGDVPTATVLNPTSTTAIACEEPTLCTDGDLELAALGFGLHEIEVVAVTAGIPVSASFPVAVVPFDIAMLVALQGIALVSSLDPFGIGLDLQVPYTELDYARAIFQSNPIAALSLLDQVNQELTDIANGLYFTTDLDVVIDTIARARFFASRSLLETTLSERTGDPTWDLLAGDVITSPAFPFDAGEPFHVNINLILADLSDALADLDAVAQTLAVKDMDNADAMTALTGGGVAGYDSDAVIDASYADDEDWFALVNNTASPINVVAVTSGTACSTYAIDTEIAWRSADGTHVSYNDDYGDGYCSRLVITVPANSVAYAGVFDLVDRGTRPGNYRLSLDFGGDGNAATPEPEVEPNDDGTPSASFTTTGDDFSLTVFGAGSDAARIALRNTQLLGTGVTDGTVAMLLDPDADGVPPLQAAAMLDGDDIMAALVGRPPLTLTDDATRTRAVYNNDADAAPGERAYGRYILASVRDSMNDTLALSYTGVVSGATLGYLQTALLDLDTIAVAMAEFPEGYNVSPVFTGEIGANERLMREVYLSAQDALENLSFVQTSAIDTSSWLAGIALGLNSVSRFSAFTGTRPMSDFRDETDAVAAFECRYGKALLNLMDGDYGDSIDIFTRSKCQLIDVYNEHYARGSSSDPQRIPDDRCIDPSEFNCPVSGAEFANGCDRIDQGFLLQALAEDPGWDRDLAFNCGLGDPYNPEPITLPLAATNVTLPSNDVVPQPYCYEFTLAAPGPLNVRTLGGCEVDGEDTELSLFGTGLAIGPINTLNVPASNRCDAIGEPNLPAGDYVVCVGNRSSSIGIVNTQIEITTSSPCVAGEYDHDLEPSTACLTCSAGQECPGGLAQPIACDFYVPARVDDDGNPATACVSRIAGAFTWGDANNVTVLDDFPLENGSLQDVAVDEFGSTYVLTTWAGAMQIGALVFDNTSLPTGEEGAAAIIAFGPLGALRWIALLAPGVAGPGFNGVRAAHVVVRDGVVYTAGDASNADGSIPMVHSFGPNGEFVGLAPLCIFGVGGTCSFAAGLSADTGAVAWRQADSSLLAQPGSSVRGIALDGAGDIVVTGVLGGAETLGSVLTPLGTQDSFVATLDRVGGTVASAFSLLSGAGTITANAITVATNGDYVIVGDTVDTSNVLGTSLVSAGGTDGFVVRASPSGTLVSAEVFGGVNDDSFQSVEADRSNGVFVGGRYFEDTTIGAAAFAVSAGNTGVLLLSVEASGGVVWVSGQSGAGANSLSVLGAGLRHLAVDRTGPIDRVRFAPTMFAGDLFGSATTTTAMPGAPAGFVDFGLRDVTVDGATGLTSSTLVRSFPMPATGAIPIVFTSLAINPVTGNAAIVGIMDGSTTLDDQALITQGRIDQFLLRLSY